MLHFRFNRRALPRVSLPATADQRLGLGLDRRPKVRKTFEFIFKETLGGIEALHSRSDTAQHLDRYGPWFSTAPALRSWLNRWMRSGGLAIR